jgi:hypothetical protein
MKGRMEIASQMRASSIRLVRSFDEAKEGFC